MLLGNAKEPFKTFPCTALPRWTAKWAVRVREDFNFSFWAQLAHLIQLGDYESKRLIRKAFIVMAKFVI